jgi:hypothetical protein
MKQNLKKLLFYLQHFDGLWSVPLAFAIFWFAGILLQAFFGYGSGTYDPGFIQPLFLAAAVVIGATNVAVMGMFFTFKGLYRYLYGEKNTEGNIINYSKFNWKQLTSWQRYLVAFSVFFYYVSAVIIVYLKMV